MKTKMIVAFLVSWRITGTAISPCPAGTKPNPFVGFCVSPVDMTRNQSFDTKHAAKAFENDLKAFKSDGVKVTEIHLYSEDGGDK